MKQSRYQSHPVAAMFPMVSEDSKEWRDLKGSIQKIGQLDPIIVDGDVLLDGRNRLRACEQLGKAPRIVEWATLGVKVSQSEWIAAKNIDRRHLTDDQRATIIASIALWQLEDEAKEAKKRKPAESVDTKSYPQNTAEKNARSTVGKIAEKANVSHHKAAQAVKLAKEARENPEVAKAQERVAAGEIKLVEAVKPRTNETADHHPGDTDSDALWTLKDKWRRAKCDRTFRRLSKRDKTAFLNWITQ